MDLSATLGSLSEKMRDISSRGQALLKPPPIRFGGPCQFAPEPGVSWWHVSLFIEPTAVHQKSIPACTVRLAPLDSANLPINMRWRTRESMTTYREIALEEGRLYLVPVVARKEVGQRAAILTNETFLAQRKAKFVLPPGRSRWKLEVRSEDKEWESGHSYLLKVPPAYTSNGGFTLEMCYDGLG